MPHTYTNLLTHVIFSTKNREPPITTPLSPPQRGGALAMAPTSPALDWNFFFNLLGGISNLD